LNKKKDMQDQIDHLLKSNMVLTEEAANLRRELRNSQALERKSKESNKTISSLTLKIEGLQRELKYLRDEDTRSAAILAKVVEAGGPVIGNGSYNIIELVQLLRKAYDLFYSNQGKTGGGSNL
jgi:hypothetical protein